MRDVNFGQQIRLGNLRRGDREHKKERDTSGSNRKPIRWGTERYPFFYGQATRFATSGEISYKLPLAGRTPEAIPDTSEIGYEITLSMDTSGGWAENLSRASMQLAVPVGYSNNLLAGPAYPTSVNVDSGKIDLRLESQDLTLIRNIKILGYLMVASASYPIGEFIVKKNENCPIGSSDIVVPLCYPVQPGGRLPDRGPYHIYDVVGRQQLRGYAISLGFNPGTDTSPPYCVIKSVVDGFKFDTLKIGRPAKFAGKESPFVSATINDPIDQYTLFDSGKPSIPTGELVAYGSLDSLREEINRLRTTRRLYND